MGDTGLKGLGLLTLYNLNEAEIALDSAPPFPPFDLSKQMFHKQKRDNKQQTILAVYDFAVRLEQCNYSKLSERCRRPFPHTASPTSNNRRPASTSSLVGILCTVYYDHCDTTTSTVKTYCSLLSDLSFQKKSEEPSETWTNQAALLQSASF